MHTPSSHPGSPRRRAIQRPVLALWLLVTAATLAPPAQAASIYLCKAYNGGTFWSSAHCRQHGALIDRIESVPDGLPFDQQVALAEQSRAAAAGLQQQSPAPSLRSSPAMQGSSPSRGEECRALDAHITQLDAMARQPQTGERQDWIRSRKQKARDRQFQLRC